MIFVEERLSLAATTTFFLLISNFKGSLAVLSCLLLRGFSGFFHGHKSLKLFFNVFLNTIEKLQVPGFER